jgi:hypothetical protein
MKPRKKIIIDIIEYGQVKSENDEKYYIKINLLLRGSWTITKLINIASKYNGQRYYILRGLSSGVYIIFNNKDKINTEKDLTDFVQELNSLYGCEEPKTNLKKYKLESFKRS